MYKNFLLDSPESQNLLKLRPIRLQPTLMAIILSVGFFINSVFTPVFVALATAWPADPVGSDIAPPLQVVIPAFEPSGVIYHPDRNSYIVVSDEGDIAELAPDGAVLHSWSLGASYDLEDVTIGLAPNLVYLAEENTSRAYAFNLTTGTLTGWYTDFSAYITEVGGINGMEGLAFVLDGNHPYGVTTAGGLFYAGWQEDGDIYLFEPNFAISTVGIFKTELHMTTGYTDLSALYFNNSTATLYAVYDGLNILEERSADGIFITNYSLPGDNQEGFTLGLSGELYDAVVAEDNGRIMNYKGFSVVPEPPAPVEEPAPITIEFQNGLDDDADGIIDEANTVAENGLHPIYSLKDPAINTDILTVVGTVNGEALVTYKDTSTYLYPVFPGLKVKTSLKAGTAYIKVTKAGGAKVWINGLTGEVL
ncbi:MAG: SdiA-regulated domain-containing protein [Patescibacteria group bacterium]